VREANTDYLARGSRLPTPSTAVERKGFSIGPGGKGAMQAVAAAWRRLRRAGRHRERGEHPPGRDRRAGRAAGCGGHRGDQPTDLGDARDGAGVPAHIVDKIAGAVDDRSLSVAFNAAEHVARVPDNDIRSGRRSV
jgi:hypothetical protein